MASGRRLSSTSSMRSRSSSGMSWYTGRAPALTIAMSRPASMAWYRKQACIASRTALLPRNENDTFDTPPETWTCGQRCLISRVPSKNAWA